jgi:pimeloyl-ACP methyl ester carboxylesterase
MVDPRKSLQMSTTDFEDTKTATVNGATLAYREVGRGEPVVFVHGTASDLRTWEQQWPVLGRSHRAIAYSRRFARPNADISRDDDDPMLTHVEDLAQFLRAVDAAPAHVVGHSWGAFVSLLAAARHPELIRSLVLAEPPALTLFVSTPPRPSELLRLFMTRPRTAMAILKFGAGTIARAESAFRAGRDDDAMQIFARGVLGKEAFEATSTARKEQMRENLGAARAQLLGAGFPPLADDEVRSIGMPVLLMTGEDSPAVFLRVCDRLEELLPHAKRIEIPGGTHSMHEQNPTAVNAAIAAFIERSRAGSAS